METKEQSEVISRTGYSDAIKAEALQQRMNGRTYCEVAKSLDVPEDTLKKWFAPSINRHNLATLKEEQFEELTSASKKLLQANVLSITEKLTEKALEGDMRAIIEVMDRVHGTPIKQRDQMLDEMPKSVQVTFYSTKEEIEKLEALKKEISELKQIPTPQMN